MKSNKKPAVKELQKTLESENPTWKIPDRRVSKFLKRELKKRGLPPPESSPEDDDEESIISSSTRARELARSTVGSLKKVVSPGKAFFSFRKKKQQKQAASSIDIPPMEISTHKMAQASPLNDEIVDDSVFEQPMLELEPEPEPEPKGVGLNNYADDNDGSKENQLCANNCVIL